MYQLYADKALQMIERHLQGVCSISMLCRALGIAVKRVEGSALSEGYAMLLHGKAYILLQSGLSVSESRFTLAHELAHLLLGHVGDWNNIQQRSLPESLQEWEADELAGQILDKFYH